MQKRSIRHFEQPPNNWFGNIFLIKRGKRRTSTIRKVSIPYNFSGPNGIRDVFPSQTGKMSECLPWDSTEASSFFLSFFLSFFSPFFFWGGGGLGDGKLGGGIGEGKLGEGGGGGVAGQFLSSGQRLVAFTAAREQKSRWRNGFFNVSRLFPVTPSLLKIKFMGGRGLSRGRG